MNTKKLLLLVLTLLCVTCLVFSACHQTPNSNAISGLTDISLKCGDTLPTIAPVAEYGTVTVTIAKAVDGTAKENLTYGALPNTLPQVGTYYLKATVQAGDNYEGATAYATLTISHKSFAEIAGEGTFKEEATADGKYKTWVEKECPCGEIIKGNEQVNDKKANVISGLEGDELVCGSAIDVSGVSATNGTPVIKVALAVEGTEKEDLTYIDIPSTCTHGVYYVRATVAESDEYLSATAYAKVTVNHQAYADITTEVQHQAAEGTTKGYDYKLCACGEHIHGETEYVIVTIKQDGAVIDTQELAIGANVTRPADDKITARSGYVATLLLNGEVWNAGETAEDFATIELTTRWLQKSTTTIESITPNWLFNTPDLDDSVENTLTEDTVNSLWTVETLYNPSFGSSPAELKLGDIELKINHTYQLTVVSAHRTYVCFGTGTWDTNCYLITEDMANKPVVITITYTGNNTIVTYNGETRTYTNDEWPVHNLNGLNFAIQDKDAKDEAEHPRFTVSINKQVIDLYDYVADEARLVASLPAVDSIDANNAEDVLALISQIEAIRTAHFTTAQNASVTDISAHKQKAQQIAADHVLNLKKLENALPDFDTMWTADKDTQDAAYKALTKYLAYYNVKFTAEEKEAYTEPEKIAFYREFFKDRVIVTDNAFAESTASFIPWDDNPTSHWNPNNQSGTITLPQIAYGAFDRVTFIIVSAGGETRTLTYGDVVITDNWGQFIITKQADGWYANFAVPDAHTGNSVKLSDEIVLGNEGIQVQFKNSGWGWLRIQANGNDSSINQISGTLTAGTTTVHQITYSYQTNAGEQTKTQYYLDNATLVLPNVSDYTDNVGKHTFLGWFVDDTQYNAGDVITASAKLVAKYEVREGDYTNYTVSFVDEDGEKLAEPQTSHYEGALVLPDEPTKTYQGTGKHYVFEGWFDDYDVQYKGGELIKADLQLIAEFKLVDDERTEFKVTLTNLDGENQTVSVYDGEVAELPTVTRDGYIFDGWYKDGSKYDTTAEVTDNITLAAKWLVPVTEKQTIISASDLSTQVTGTLNADRGAAYDKTDSWWVDSEGTKYDKWFLVGNNDPTKQEHNGIRTFTFPLINMSKYSQLNFVMLMDNANVGTVSTPDPTTDAPDRWTDIGSAKAEGQCMRITITKIDGVWTLVSTWNNGNKVSIVLNEEVVNGTKPLEMRLWTNQTQWLYMSEIKAYVSSNVDYVAKATEAATAIENLAVDADNATKLAALKTYMTWRTHFTSTELTANPMSAKAIELQTALKTAGVKDVVWTPTADNLSDIGFQGNSDHVGVATMGQTWMKDKDSNIFQTAYSRNCQGTQNIELTLPVINFATYSDVRFCLWVQNTAGTTQSLIINEQTAQMDACSSTVYVVYIKTVNNVTTFEVCYNGSSEVVSSGSISWAVAHGEDALKLTVSVDGWTQIRLSEIYGIL